MTKGTLRFTKEFTTILDPVLDGDGLLILGQEQDTFGGGFDKFQSFSGKISQFNMFQRWVKIWISVLVTIILITHHSNSIFKIFEKRNSKCNRHFWFREEGGISYFILDIILCNCRALTEAEIVSLYRCETDLKGDLVTWTASRWSQRDGATSASVPYQTFCQQSFSDEVILLPDAMSYDRAQFMCSVLSGENLHYIIIQHSMV